MPQHYEYSYYLSYSYLLFGIVEHTVAVNPLSYPCLFASFWCWKQEGRNHPEPKASVAFCWCSNLGVLRCVFFIVNRNGSCCVLLTVDGCSDQTRVCAEDRQTQLFRRYIGDYVSSLLVDFSSKCLPTVRIFIRTNPSKIRLRGRKRLARRGFIIALYVLIGVLHRGLIHSLGDSRQILEENFDLDGTPTQKEVLGVDARCKQWQQSNILSSQSVIKQ